MKKKNKTSTKKYSVAKNSKELAVLLVLEHEGAPEFIHKSYFCHRRKPYDQDGEIKQSQF